MPTYEKFVELEKSKKQKIKNRTYRSYKGSLMKFIVIFMAVSFGVCFSWFANSVNLKAEEITTENLISQNFTDSSWNNPVNSWHAPKRF